MGTAPHTSVRVTHPIGALQMQVDFALTQPWTVLFGPSGSGKTTLLRAIAGLLRPAHGRIACGGVTLFDSATGVDVPAHRRGIPLAAQQARLFPQRTVRRNLNYASEICGDAARTRESEERLAQGFGIEQLLDRMPAQLSGGEAQRANLARAVAAPNSRLLLLDEPFTGMDAARRESLLPWLRDALAERGVPVLSVTHDVAEAFQLGAEVIQIADGKVAAQGPVEMVLAAERMRLMAQLNANQ